jgi:hypothetical protein
VANSRTSLDGVDKSNVAYIPENGSLVPPGRDQALSLVAVLIAIA